MLLCSSSLAVAVAIFEYRDRSVTGKSKHL
jgi:hypothetical protein